MAKPDKKQETNRLLNLSNLGYDKSSDQIRPTRKFRVKGGETVINFEQFPSQVQKILNYWITQCHDNAQSFENRKLLYNDIDTIYTNSALISRAMDLMADEVVQADTNFRTVDVEAVPKVKDFILKFFDDINLEDFIRPTALSIIKYGNGGWVPATDDYGICEIVPIEIHDLIDRIEFSAHEVKQQLKDSRSTLNKMSQSAKLKMLIDSVLKKQNYESYLKSYLFGFQVGDFILPPWKFIHFRNLVHESPFAPFGQPMFIHAIAPYRQFDAAMSLQMAARAARFPIYKYELDMPNVQAKADKLQLLQEFIAEFDNSGIHTTRKEEFGVGERLFTVKGVFDFVVDTPDIDLGRMDDIEMMRDDLILATGMPRHFLDPNASAFGSSGISLTQQFKPFARKVYMVQSILMAGISQMVKIHMIMSGKFSDEDIDFQLTMPYPESQTDRELIGSQTDLLGLANSVLDSISQRIVGDQNAVLPPELVRDVYAQILPYDTNRIDDWVKGGLISKQDKAAGIGAEGTGGAPGGAEPAPGGGGGAAPAGGGDMGGLDDLAAPAEGEEAPPEEAGAEAPAEPLPESVQRRAKVGPGAVRLLIEKIGRISFKEAVQGLIFEAKQKKIRNIAIGGKHLFSSRNRKEAGDFPAEKLLEFRVKQTELLKEEVRRQEQMDFGHEIFNPIEELMEEKEQVVTGDLVKDMDIGYVDREETTLDELSDGGDEED